MLASVKGGTKIVWHHCLQWPRKPQYCRWNCVCGCWG